MDCFSLASLVLLCNGACCGWLLVLVAAAAKPKLLACLLGSPV